MSARLPHAIALAAVLALLLAPPVSAGPLRKALRLAVRQARGVLEARRAGEAARALRERLLADRPAWLAVHAGGSSTAPAPSAWAVCPRMSSELRPRGNRR